MTDQLQQLLKLRYPLVSPATLSDAVCESLKERHCAVAGDYGVTLRRVGASPEGAGGHGVLIQLPVRVQVGPSAEELAEREARRCVGAAALPLLGGRVGWGGVVLEQICSALHPRLHISSKPKHFKN